MTEPAKADSVTGNFETQAQNLAMKPKVCWRPSYIKKSYKNIDLVLEQLRMQLLTQLTIVLNSTLLH